MLPSQKKIFSVLGFGFSWGVVTSGGVFAFLWENATLPGPGRPSNGPTFWPKYFYETRLSHESLEPLIGFLAYLDQNLCHKNQKVVKRSTPKRVTNGRITPCLYMAITRHKNRLESCSNPLKIREGTGKKIFQLEITVFLLMFAYSEVVYAYFCTFG